MKTLGMLGTIVLVALAGQFDSATAATLMTLHSFNASDGAQPGGLVQGSDGNFYGTTYSGGANNSGTVFRISPSGSFTNLHSFSGSDGGYLGTNLVSPVVNLPQILSSRY